MKLNLLKLLPFLAILLLASCKKDKTSVADLLKDSKGWVQKSITTDPPLVILGTPITDIFAQLDNCVKDDIIFFQDNNKYVTDEGPTKCNPLDPQTETGTWALSADEKVITVDGESWDVLELTKSTLKVKYNYVDGGLTYAFTATFAHP